MKITSQENFWSGVMFITFGLAAIFIAQDYPFGSSSRMGPGYFPTWLGIILTLLGIAISVTGFKVQGEGIGKFAWKAMAFLSTAFVLFGWAIDRIGFVPAMFIIIFLAAAGRDFRIKEVLVSSIVLVIGCWALFIKGLELPFPLFWWR
ncbi:MAG: tripartite tricarboxylate transporter TctB family protein [Burkholderiales bacterium]|nr:tripartite tricarboxylate transporter TctB family protein [Burkholderiales bacterium]